MSAITILCGRCTIHIGDVLAMLAAMPADSVDCVVTSPPYWGLRDYGVEGQIGLEATLGEHLDVMVRVFEAIKRVLKPEGTLWLNYGDCYATQPNGRSAADQKAAGTDDRTFRDKPFSTVQGTLKPKDLCMIPNRLAIALQDAGWWVRSEIIWAKPNAMPDSSGRFRPASAHEKIFLLSKNADAGGWWVARDTGEVDCSVDLSETVTVNGKELTRWTRLGHYYDAGAVRVDRSTPGDGKAPDGWDTGKGGHGSYHRNGREKGAPIDKQRGHSRRHAGFNDRWDHMTKAEQQSNGRLLRNVEPAPPAVWTMATAAFRDAHFATFPPELVERCIDAGCPPNGHVLDPFGGAGTTALVAIAKGHTCDLIELNPEYGAIASRRIEGVWQGDVERTLARMKTIPLVDAGPLFKLEAPK